MPGKRRMIQIGFLAVLVLASWHPSAGPALASKPVPRTVSGCVVNGIFVSTDGYHIRPMDANFREVDLLPFEGLRVTISGDLLPGDALIVKTPPRASGPCEIATPLPRRLPR